MTKKIGFIGCGNMAYALIAGMLKTGHIKPEQIIASNPSLQRLELISDQLKINVTQNNHEVVAFADIIILTIKPNKYDAVIQDIKDLISDQQVIVTVAAGISTQDVESIFGHPVRIIRTMPNTPAAVNAGMTGLCANAYASDEDLQAVTAIFNAVGTTQIVDEAQMNVVTAVAGSSPAMVYILIEAMADAAVLKGMNRDHAYRMSAQAVLGAAKMVLDSGIHPGQLKDQVTSAGGTTIEAIYTLEKRGFRGTVMEAIDQCVNKAIYLAQQYKK